MSVLTRVNVSGERVEWVVSRLRSKQASLPPSPIARLTVHSR